jgi:hypothetical protein
MNSTIIYIYIYSNYIFTIIIIHKKGLKTCFHNDDDMRGMKLRSHGR